ncbi:hypothetical protein SY88_16730 [Clostridiales bacterium PH28_bin88]|nr:hypothetical protein SY88_16730 [Clostridiales bacterium PH28_bin88]
MYKFKTLTGEIAIDTEKCSACRAKPCIAACLPQILKEENAHPALVIDREAAAKGKCIECLACELDCHYQGKGGLTVLLPLPEVPA